MKTLTKEEAKRLSPGALAFYGDCVYEDFVRRSIVLQGDRPSAALHSMSVKMVRASYQSAAYEKLLTVVDEEEADILRRGRNSTGITAPKSSNPAEYHRATAVEALFGYLSLAGMCDRAEELFTFITDQTGKEKV